MTADQQYNITLGTTERGRIITVINLPGTQAILILRFCLILVHLLFINSKQSMAIIFFLLLTNQQMKNQKNRMFLLSLFMLSTVVFRKILA